MFIDGIGYAFAKNDTSSPSVVIDINSAIHFVKSYGVIEEDISGNSLGLYNIVTNVKDGKVKFIQAVGGGYITQSRPASCAWNPQGGITFNKSEVTLNAHAIQVQHCTEDIPCMEGIFGQGNDVEDLLATEVGTQMYQELIQIIYRGIGNDFAKSCHWGKHPVIAQAKASWVGDSTLWARIEKTLNINGGWLGLIDALAAKGTAALNVQINPDHFNGTKYTGDVDAFFTSLTEAMTPKFKALAETMRMKGQNPIIMVSGGIFEAYRKWLQTNRPGVIETLKYKLTDDFCASFGCVGGTKTADVLEWEGFWIKRMHVWDTTAADLQIIHHRAVVTPSNNLGIGLDVQADQLGGMGLRVQQKTDVDQAGIIVMGTNYRMGTAIIAEEFLVNAVAIGL
ncbi:MAG: hypothetical protein ABI851_12175 [Saprospiraceae bacterium]